MAPKDADSLLEILSERLIKPSSSTPPPLRCHKLSRRDQMIVASYVARAFFYPSHHDTIHVDGEDNRSLSTAEISQLLQTSVSKTLTYYYPFAGRLANNCFVDCNDAGVQYTEARINCSMSEILRPEKSHLRDVVFPRCYFSGINPTESSPVILQASFFNCGGFAVAVCATHKLLDACTTCNFMNDWAGMARGVIPATPLFNGASLFPPLEDDSCKNEVKVTSRQENCITRRFLFLHSKIDELKALAAAANSSSGVENPTRYEVLTALLYRKAMAAASKANSGSFKPSTLFNAANLRSLTVPPLPTNSAGNFATVFPVSAKTERDTEFPDLVGQLRKEKEKFRMNTEIGDADREFSSHVMFDRSYFCTSGVGFPFYRVDFGLGEPVLVSEVNQNGFKNLFRLVGTRDGNAIEASVTLDASEMPFFQANQELLAFATLLY